MVCSFLHLSLYLLAALGAPCAGLPLTVALSALALSLPCVTLCGVEGMTAQAVACLGALPDGTAATGEDLPELPTEAGLY